MNEHGTHWGESLVVSMFFFKFIYCFIIEYFHFYFKIFRYHISWFNVNICSLVPCNELLACLHWCEECLCFFGSPIFQFNNYCYFFSYKRIKGTVTCSYYFFFFFFFINFIFCLKDTGAGLVAASMIAIVPGYISRSVAGSYDNEGIAIFCMLLTYFFWIKSVKTGSLLWSALCALAYFYMVKLLSYLFHRF